MTQTSSKSQEKKAARLQQVLDTLTIDCDPWGTFAVVPSTSDATTTYTVTIDESGDIAHAEHCNCTGHTDYHRYCIHMQGTDLLFARTSMHIEEVAYSAIEEALDVAEEIEAHATDLEDYDVLTAAGAVAANVVNYDEIAAICQGCCRIFRPEHASQALCRRCC